MNKEVAESLKPLSRTLEEICKPLDVLAVLAVAKEFYTDEERMHLYARYAELQTADQAAFEALSKSGPDDNLGWDERVKQHGEALAREQMAPRIDAQEKRKVTMAALSAFRREHGLVVRIIEYRSQLVK